MKNPKIPFEWNMFYSIIKYLVGWAMGILSYEALLEVCLFCFGFLIISWINFSTDTPTLISVPMLVPILKWLKVEESHQYGTEEIKSFLSKVISVLGIVGAVLHFLISRLLKIKLKINRWWGLGIIIVPFTLSLISCFSPTAKDGAKSIIPVLVFFLFFSLFSYGRYRLFQRIGERILSTRN